MLKRLFLYINEMYNPLTALPASIFSFFAIYFTLSVLNGQNVLHVTVPSIVGSLTIFLFLLFLRVSDEFKDFEVDKRLFPNRPLPSGRVFEKDLKILMAVTLIIAFAINFIWGKGLIGFLLLFFFGFLMLKYFFFPQYISKSLLLALLTHNPSVLFIDFYVISVFCDENHLSVFTLRNFFILILFWVPALCWELSRKIKAPSDENDYVTYSKIFGYKVAALLPMACISIHYIMLVYLIQKIHLGVIFFALLTIVFIAFQALFLRFIFNPSTKSSKLKPVTEAYLLLTSLGLVIALIIGRSISWLT